MLAQRSLRSGLRAYDRGDYARAMKEFVPLAQRGNAIAQLSLGIMYHEGRGVQQDDLQAVRWLRKAAEAGDADAQFQLSRMHMHGWGVQSDEAEIVHWLRLSATQGHARAQFYLGIANRDGRGIPANGSEAKRWLYFSADQGQADVQVALGFMYLSAAAESEGRAVLKNEANAHFWLSLGAANGDESGVQVRDAVARELPEEVLAASGRLLAEWKAKTRAESTLEVYKSDVTEFVEAFCDSTKKLTVRDAAELLNRTDGLLRTGVALRAPIELLNTLVPIQNALGDSLAETIDHANGQD